MNDKNYFKDAFIIDASNPRDIWRSLMMKDRCSAMIKVVYNEEGDMVDLLAGHTTWSEYTETYRFIKQYNIVYLAIILDYLIIEVTK